MPDVFEVISVPGLRNFSTWSKICFLISSLSTTTSIIQSQVCNVFHVVIKIAGSDILYSIFCKNRRGITFNSSLLKHHLRFYFLLLLHLLRFGGHYIQQQYLHAYSCKMTGNPASHYTTSQNRNFLYVSFVHHNI